MDTTYGGDGITGFRLPDLRGRRWVGAGQGPDTAAFTPADSGGAETLVLTADQLPAAGAQATFTTPAAGLIPGNGHTIFDDGGGDVSTTVQAYADASRADGRFLAPAIEGGLAVVPGRRRGAGAAGRALAGGHRDHPRHPLTRCPTVTPGPRGRAIPGRAPACPALPDENITVSSCAAKPSEQGAYRHRIIHVSDEIPRQTASERGASAEHFI
ncbi:tail fiber protein [Tistrella mobilis]|uniref:phage tail protein n=1 Tax=Tistrella mobilis TaxID=171437 RepID=UPI00355908CF